MLMVIRRGGVSAETTRRTGAAVGSAGARCCRPSVEPTASATPGRGTHTVRSWLRNHATEDCSGEPLYLVRCFVIGLMFLSVTVGFNRR